MLALSFVCTLLLLLRSPLAEAASNFHLRNHTGLKYLYDLKGGYRDDWYLPSVPDLTGNNLMGNLTTTLAPLVAIVYHSTDSDGGNEVIIRQSIVGNRAQSQRTSEALLSSLTSEFTLEFFFSSPVNNAAKRIRIAGFGDWPSGSEFSFCDETNVNTFGGWQLYSSVAPSGIVFQGVLVDTINDNQPYCFTIGVTISANTMRHLVVRARDGLIQMISHGNTQSDPSVKSFSADLWARHPAPLTIGSPHVDTGWTGTMYMAAMYDRFLSATEIENHRIYGPPNSFPVASAMATTVLEDSLVSLYP